MGDIRPQLSVVIPCYNERRFIAQVLTAVKQSIANQALDAEIVVVNDGSSDRGAEILAAIPGIVFIDLPRNRGKGGAVKAGIEAAKGDVILIQDADLEYSPDDYSAVIAPIAKGTADLVMGSRFLESKPKFWGKGGAPYFTHYIGNILIVWLTNHLYGNRATDYEACYKAFTRHLAATIPIRSNGFEYDNELICKALKRGFRVVEVPVQYNPRSYEEGKKITWRHGVKMLWTICKYRVTD